jgi:hypothetical protein
MGESPIRVRLVVVVQQTFGGFLNFVPHLHPMVSASGLHVATNRWIRHLKFDKPELMRAWRFALVAYLAGAVQRNVLNSDVSSQQLLSIFQTQYKREWNIFISRAVSRIYWLRHDGRYIRRPPIAQRRMSRIGSDHIKYLVEHTRKEQFVSKRYTNVECLNVILQAMPERGRHGVRYFGLLSPRSKAKFWSGIFVLLRTSQRERPRRRSWRLLLMRTFGRDLLLDSNRELMQWVGRQAPVHAI